MAATMPLKKIIDQGVAFRQLMTITVKTNSPVTLVIAPTSTFDISGVSLL